MSNYAVARLDDIAEQSDGRCPWRPVRHHFGITSFGANAWTGRTSATGSSTSTTRMSRAATRSSTSSCRAAPCSSSTASGWTRLPAPSSFARPGVKRTAFAEEPETTILALGGTPGEKYEPHGWEFWAPMAHLYESGEYAELADRLGEVVAEHPEYADLFYNLACCESLAGRTDDAIEHLRRSIELSPERSRALAQDDSDFDAIRDEPAFKELIDH